MSSLAKSYYGTAVSTTTANAPGINGGNTVAGRRRLFAAPFEGAGGWAQWLWGRR